MDRNQPKSSQEYQALAAAIASARSKAELDEIKKTVGEDDCQVAWKLLSKEDKDRIKLICVNNNKIIPMETKGKYQVEEYDGVVEEEENLFDSFGELPHPQTTTSNQHHQSLWGLSSELISLENALTEVDLNDDLTEDEKEQQRQNIFTQWLSTSEDWEEKIESCGYAAKCLEKEADALKSMVDDLRERQARKKAESDRLKRYMMLAMESRGITKVKGKFSTIYTRIHNPIRLNVASPEELPKQYQRVKVEPNLVELRKALKSGEDLDCAYFGEEEKKLVVRIK